MRFIPAISLTLAVSLIQAQPQTAPPPQSKASQPKPPQIPIQQFKLDNGLRIVMSEDHAAPTYAISVTYNVGSHNERLGRTGFAHLFEHMMYQGSENVGKGEHMILVENNGGSMNGTTNEDRTNYFEAFASNQLDLGLFLESDRMRSLVISQANLDNQRNAVQEERRLGLDNQPYGKTGEVVQDLVYDNFANKHDVIGSMDDLNAATIKDVQDFFRINYAPNNAVLTLVGDFQPQEALAKIKKYFGEIPAQPAPPVPDLSEPKPSGERRKTIEDAFAQTPRLDIVFKIPPGNTDDWYALDVLGSALGSGQASRLYQSLVKEKELAVNVFTEVENHRGPSTFDIAILARPGKDLKEVEKAVYAEIDRLKAEPIADWELQKVRMSNRRQAAQRLQSTLFRAYLIGEMAVYYNDPNLINTRFSKIQSVNKDEIQRVAKTYLTQENRTVVATLPKPKPEVAAKAAN
ncbi:MAG TPA: pitrilysin family protein [Bryobacteraceae bacterium]|jgi:predicted Zn-dependent peptidase|nr:pitrilysin family protein [Bryobacteraceae bacterium]